MSFLNSESHLHLYGCLPVKSLYEASFERSKKHSGRFQWFLSEYKKFTGVSLNPQRWWNQNNGFDIFKDNFLCLQPCAFDHFQARFNLLIALYPPNPDDMDLANSVFSSHAKDGGYKEYRTFLPLYLPEEQRTIYLRNLLLVAQTHETKSYHPRLAISFSRNEPDAWESYRFLINFFLNFPEFKKYITGIDFCGNERGHEPSSKKTLFSKILSDKSQGLHDLEILYHVGEMWIDIGLHSAARWCVEAGALGVQRLGHALALGLDPQSVKGRTIQEKFSETTSHLNWLSKNRHDLLEYDFTVKDYDWFIRRAEKSTSGQWVLWHYDDELIEHTSRFQSAALNLVKKIDPVVETCPTSNIRIGAIGNPKFHPAKRFLDHNLRLTISTDDPGVFDVSLQDEEIFLRQTLSIQDDDFKNCEKTTRSLFEGRG